MRKLFAVLLSIALLVIAGITYSAFPVKTFTVCKGELESKCSDATYHIGCSDSEEVFAQQICTVTEDGKKRVRAYSKEVVSGPISGNQCGYWTWKFQCGTE